MDLGIPFVLVILVTLPIIAFVKGIRRRSLLGVAVMVFFVLVSFGGCAYFSVCFWRHFCSPNYEGDSHMVGLAVFAIAGVLVLGTALVTILTNRNQDVSQ